MRTARSQLGNHARFDRPQWVGTGLSRPPLNFQPGNLLCWLDRRDSAKSGRWGSETFAVGQMMDADIVYSNAWYCTAVHLVAYFDKQDLHLYLAISLVHCFK